MNKSESLWSRDNLIKFIEMNNDPITRKMTGDEVRTAYRAMMVVVEAAIRELQAGGVTLEKWKIPATADIIPAGLLYSIAAIFTYGTKFGQYLKPDQINYLANADTGMYTTKSVPEYLGLGDDVEQVLNDALWGKGNLSDYQSPDLLRTDPAAVDLAYAFYRQMLEQTPQRPPHALGEYRMTKTDIDLIDDLKLKELRFVITPVGFWMSVIFPDNTYAPAWWCPEGDTFILNYGQRFAWVFRTFAACFWRDLHVEYERAFHVKKDRSRRPAGTARPGEKVVVLPKQVRTLTWDDDMAHNWDAGRKKDYSVRAHYRLLAEGWQASETAVENAQRYGFPEPPDGYTFVSPYTVGDDIQGRPARIVAKGLSAAKVALARL